MSSPAQPDVPIWTTVQELLVDDDRVTPQLQGFLSLGRALSRSLTIALSCGSIVQGA